MINLADWVAYVGFDYHDSFIQVCVLDSAGSILGNERVDNDLRSIEAFVDNVRLAARQGS